MRHPEFFDDVARIVLRDPLAELLGSAEDGLVEYGYADAVKLTGHSCPTVAGAYLMNRRALGALYRDERPERGAIRADFREAATAGVTGVIASVTTLITGATFDTGFKGIAGRFDRRQRLFFDAPIGGDLRLQRLDTGAAVDVRYQPQRVPADPALPELMPKVLAGAASEAERAEFRRLWQERVRRILLEHADDDALLSLRHVPAGA
ncbi:hypothetical protein KJ059_16005 [Myxococcota bacterium]|nr:hypothetical protein [Myxococcota bacterium]MCZ7618108.1 FmdE family protein [Myxococcota bacterium]